MLKQVVRATTKSFVIALNSKVGAATAPITDLTYWRCFIQLRDVKTKDIAGGVDREVTTKNQEGTKFVITLTDSDTNVEEGFYRLGMEFRNSQTGQVIEDADNICEIHIVEEWVYD
tara:strand:+ start:109 stop:456 length:348 start_codon:yes stop_codon:yes gene_type:complete